MDKKVTLYDNFLSEIDNFDIVIASNNKRGYSSSEVGVVYNKYYIGYENFSDRDKNSSVSFTKYPLHEIGTFKEVASLNESEAERVQIRAVIKVQEPSDSMKFLRYNLLLALKEKGTKSDVPVSILNAVTSEAETRGII